MRGELRKIWRVLDIFVLEFQDGGAHFGPFCLILVDDLLQSFDRLQLSRPHGALLLPAHLNESQMNEERIVKESS